MGTETRKKPDSTASFQGEGVAGGEQRSRLEALRIPPDRTLTIHMVHLNHLDLSWYWQLPDTVEMCLETVRWNVELLEEHPDARYSHTQVFILRIVEQLDPDLFERFRKLVKSGRIEIDSGQVVEPDHNMPDGESLARQFLYGQNYIREKFGIRARVLINSDSFGHCRSLPQILKQAGIDFMLFKRPRQIYADLPETPFRWKGIDGTLIGALRFINKGQGLPSLSQYYPGIPAGLHLQAKIDFNLSAGITHLFGSHCAADSGGATPYLPPMAGDRWKLVYDTPSQFVEALSSDKVVWPVIDRDLNFIYTGCYTTHIEEKEHCRRAERELRQLELLAVIAGRHGMPYPAAELTRNWLDLAFLQFHDIVTGTGSHEAHMDSAALYTSIFLDLGMLRRKLQIFLDGLRNTGTAAVKSFSALNTQAGNFSGPVTTGVELPMSRFGSSESGDNLPATGLLRTADGLTTPYQIVESRWRQRFGRGRMIFVAQNLKPLALSRFELVPGSKPEPGGDSPAAQGVCINNGLLRIEAGQTGILRSIRRIRDGREFLSQATDGVRIELWPETSYRGDYGSPMKAWFLGVTGNRENATPAGAPEIAENGPVRSTIRLKHAWGRSLFITDISLYRGQEWVEIRCSIDWQEKEVLCRLCVNPALSGPPVHTIGIPFGHQTVDGVDGEVAATGWADVSGPAGGLAVLNRDRIGHCFMDDGLRVSLVRCATGDYDACTDSGAVSAELRLVPHDGSPASAGIPGLADEFNCPPLAWQIETGAAPRTGVTDLTADPVLSVPPDIHISACKQAEDGSGLVVRLWESAGRGTDCSVQPGTGVVPSAVYESNILEDRLSQLKMDGRRIPLRFRPFEIKTLLLLKQQHE